LPTIQNEIITARINKGLTQRELGERLGYQSKSAQVTVARWEAGTRPVPREKILELCKLLDLDPMMFLR
jgi:transcriptional regulator with XRE-family HTH domain